jgi:hypothetical protein
MQGSGVQNGADAKPAMSSTWADTGILNDQHLETPDEAAARECQEKLERHQEEFRKRGEGQFKPIRSTES